MLKSEIQILIADPDPAAAASLKVELRALGYTHVFEAETMAAAVTELGQNGLHVIFCDWSFHADLGLAFLKLVKRQKTHESTVFIMTSGTENDRESQVLLSAKAGVNAFLLKPIDRDQIKNALGG